MQHVFVVGAKGLGNYGGYETFLLELISANRGDRNVKYHIACKDNGQGAMCEEKLDDVLKLSNEEFVYNDAHCFKIKTLEIGPAQAIIYDLKSIDYVISYIKKHKIDNPVLYILACRIGPFINKYVKEIHKFNGKVFINPDGHEWKRSKWNRVVRKYWKLSERLMVKNADLIVCDSISIESYIKKEYKKYYPKTCYISYGSDIKESTVSNEDENFKEWMNRKSIIINNYYLMVGRFVPENNFETIIREFMKSKSKKDLVIVTTYNKRMFKQLESRLHFDNDKRIKFVGTVYDKEYLKKIRENAFAYIHGHEVGGTNPSLLESLSSTKINLLLDVSFNKEVGGEYCYYWNKNNGNLKDLIEKTETTGDEIIKYNHLQCKKIISDRYNWKKISHEYNDIFTNNQNIK